MMSDGYFKAWIANLRTLILTLPLRLFVNRTQNAISKIRSLILTKIELAET